jgi:hypothetical protein
MTKLTKLYLPFLGFTLNNQDGTYEIYKTMIESGPSYQLIVHESPSWLSLKDEVPRGDLIEIIPKKKEEFYKTICDTFFADFHEKYKFIRDTEPEPTSNSTLEYRRALSYILIAHDYKARIFDDSILDFTILSDQLRLYDIEEEIINKFIFIEKLLSSYSIESIPTLSVNKNPKIFHDVMDILNDESIKLLSEKNFDLGLVSIKKDKIIRDIKDIISEILGKEWIPYILQAPTLALSFNQNETRLLQALFFLSSVSAKVLQNYNFREYAPPIQHHRGPLFYNEGVSMYTYFNYEYKFYLKNPK